MSTKREEKCDEKVRDALAESGCTLVFEQLYRNGVCVGFEFKSVEIEEKQDGDN